MRSISGVIALLAALAVLPALLAPVTAAGAAEIRIEQAWARASIGIARPAAAYVTIANDSDRAVALTEVSSPDAGHAEIHETVKKGDTMRMAPVDRIEVPAGGRVEMAPGSLHIMLMELKQPIRKGGSVDLTLRFSNGRSVAASATVMGPGAKGPPE